MGFRGMITYQSQGVAELLWCAALHHRLDKDRLPSVFPCRRDFVELLFTWLMGYTLLRRRVTDAGWHERSTAVM